MSEYYDTYSEAAAVKGCEVVLTTGDKWSGTPDLIGKFCPVANDGFGGFFGVDYPHIHKVMGDSGWVVAPKPKKTKVTYELVTDLTINEIAKAMIDGEVFYDKDGGSCFTWRAGEFVRNNSVGICVEGDFYRRIEKPVEWWEDLDSLKFPIALYRPFLKYIASYTRDEIENGEGEVCSSIKEYRPATRAEIQQLLDNAPE